MLLLLQHIPTRMKRVASTNGGEYKGPCPWCGGKDRFIVSPEKGESGLYYCRQCNRGGDGIKFLRDYRGLSYKEACKQLGINAKFQKTGNRSFSRMHMQTSTDTPDQDHVILKPPGEPWQSIFNTFVSEAMELLWSEAGSSAREWLHRRGLRDEIIKEARLGIALKDQWVLRTALGLPAKQGKKAGGKVWIPAGLVIPWRIDGMLWKVVIRRPDPQLQPGDPRYIQVAGTTDMWSTNGLYNADKLQMDQPAILVEGEIDALSLQQEAGDLITVVATGSTEGSRRARWIAKLALCSQVLVAFDTDEAGEEAARYWIDVLPNAKRWRPYWGDPNQMLKDGANLRAWVASGLGIDLQEDYNQENLVQNDHKNIAQLREEYASRFLELWGKDVLGPLACWILFEVQEVPKNAQITPELYVDLELHRWIMEGLETGPEFGEKDRLREVLMALYEYIEGETLTS